MQLFEYITKYDYEQVVICQDKSSGLKAIIAIHDTTIGPALGGTRMWTYASDEDAIIDALRLARGMTYKNAAAGLNLGGGKTVIIGDPQRDKSEALFRAFGRYIESLGGRYITAEDVGTSVEDMAYIRMETKHVCGTVGKGGSGDPSPFTAMGVWKGMKACCLEVYGNDSLNGKTVAVQGLGHVGYYLCKHLFDEGARLIVTDINQKAVKKVVDDFNAIAVAPNDLYEIEADIFAPCALGAVINDETLPKLKCQIIAGASNNVLKEDRHGDLLDQRGILYAPDYIINAGGVINVAEELAGYDKENSIRKVSGVYENVLKVFAIAKRDKVPTYIAADRLAEERIAQLGKVRSTYQPK